ncbi:Uncharacterised protein [Mycobacterium tuberculosis]|nr:Uncharacterised protein [Mycobacterium tuberculosis]
MRDKAVLQLNRGDPFTAGLDDVFGAVGQGDEALLVDAADVTGAQPAGIELGLVTSPVIRASNPGPANLHLANGVAVVGQHLAIVVDDPGLHPAHRLALSDAECPMLVVRGARWRPGHGGQRRCFRHAPQLPNLDIVLVLEGAHQRFRNRRSAAGDQTQR